MLIFFEKIRRQIEKSSGNEGYLSAYGFAHLNSKLSYQTSSTKLVNEKDFDFAKKQATLALSDGGDWSVKQEMQAWAGAIMRDLAHGLLFSWHDKMSHDFLRASADKKNCDGLNLLESACVDLSKDPNDIYIKLLEVAKIAETISINCDTLLDEIIEWRKLKESMYSDKSEFTNCRLVAKRKSLNLTKHITKLKKIKKLLGLFSKLKTNQGGVLWTQSYLELSGVIYSLEAMLDNDVTFTEDHDFLKWLDKIFPLEIDGKHNLLLALGWHNKIVIKLRQASYCLNDYLLENKQSFVIRDKIINGHIKECMEKMAISELESRNGELSVEGHAG
ncbi:MAG: hypothetical protein JJV97_01390 [SAR324 cluster bacterium]|nr:hypothetical protein [SAR324 cluster bacterium]